MRVILAHDVLLRRVIGVGLMVDGLWAAVSMASLLSSMTGRDTVEVVMMVARLVVGAAALTAGWQVSQHRMSGPWLARWSATGTAVIMGCGLGFRWLPTSIDPGFRAPVMVMYALVAVAVVLWARRESSPGSE